MLTPDSGGNTVHGYLPSRWSLSNKIPNGTNGGPCYTHAVSPVPTQSRQPVRRRDTRYRIFRQEWAVIRISGPTCSAKKFG